MSRRALIPAALAVLLAPAGAAAQNFSLIPSLTVESRYDTNVRFRDEKSSDNSDLIGTAAPQIKLTGKTPRTGLDALYRLQADYHTRNTELNNLSHAARLNADFALSKSTDFGAGDAFTYTKDSLQASTTGILVTRTDILANSAYVNASTKLGPRHDAVIELRDTIFEYEEGALVDSRTDSASLTGGYMHGKTGRTFLNYKFTQFRFDGPEGETDFDSHLAYLGISETIYPTLTATVAGGLVYTPNLDGADFFVVAEAGFEKAFKDSTLLLSYQREVTNPAGLADELNIHDSIDFQYNQVYDRHFDFTVHGGFAKNRSEPTGRVDINSLIAGVTGRWLPYRWMEIGVGLSHFQQWTRDTIGDGLSRNRVFVNVTFIGPEWRF